jgi:hypothetical protein
MKHKVALPMIPTDDTFKKLYMGEQDARCCGIMKDATSHRRSTGKAIKESCASIV